MKLTLGDLLVPAIIIGALSWWGYSTWSDRAAKAGIEKARVEAVARDEQALADLAQRFKATRSLTDKLADRGLPVMTYQVQNALRMPTGGAVIVSGGLIDLAAVDGQYVIQLESRVGDGPAIRFFLRCDASVAAQVIAKRSAANAVSAVAIFSSVEGDPRPADAGAKATTSDATPPTRFLARGQCLDAVVR